jgi:hypothetical protein
MRSIHIEPDEIRSYCRLMDEHIRQMLDSEYVLSQSASRLDMAWQGGHSGDFLNDFQAIQKLMHEKIKDYYLLSRMLIREADRWEESDQTWVVDFRNLLK